MNKKIVMNSFKGMIFAGALTIGISIYGNQASAAEQPNTGNSDNLLTQVQKADATALLAPVMKTAAPVVDTATAAVTKTVAPVADTATAAVAKTVAPVVDTATAAVTKTVAPVVDTATSAVKKAAAPTTNATTTVKNTGANEQKVTIPEKPPVQTGNPDQKDKNIKKETNSSLINIGLGGSLLSPILGTVDLNVLGEKNVETEDSSYSTGGVLQLDVKDSGLLGDTHAGVLENTKITNDDYEYTHGALIDADVNGSVAGDLHAGVLEKETAETDEYYWEHSGLVLLDANNALLNDLHAGVLENESYETKQPNGDDHNPCGDGTQNGGDNNQPGEDDHNPSGDGTQTGGDDHNPCGDDTQNGGDNNQPGGDDHNPNGNGTQPVGDDPQQGKDQTQPCGNSNKSGDRSVQTNVPADTTFNKGSNNVMATPVSSGIDSNTKGKADVQTNVHSVQSLPKTGSAIDSSILFLISIMMMIGGFALKRFRFSLV